LSTINQISLALVSQADLDDLIKLVGNQLRDLFKADIVYIALLDKKTRIISFPFQYGDNMAPLKLGEGLTSKIILSGQPLLVNKDVQEQYSTMGINRVGIPAASYLGVPIPVSNEIIGVLSIQSTHKENHFAEKDKNLLSTIAANVGVAIRKARLYEEVKLANTDADTARKAAEDANAAKAPSNVSHGCVRRSSVLGFAKITEAVGKVFPYDKSDRKRLRPLNKFQAT
jgi:transcriptional regulator with GAF, ATPase, and Fis domain